MTTTKPSKPTFDTCGVCCEKFTEKRRKCIGCVACDYKACNVCYKTFITSEGVSTPKCMQCNTEWTGQFLKQNFSDAFIKGELRKHSSTILLQQQIAMLPATQPAVENQIIYEQYTNEVKNINKQIRELVARKNILNTEIVRIKRAQNANANGNGNGNGNDGGDGRSLFQHKCCDPECRGFVSSAWKCGTCGKFSCAQCHEVKGATSAEVEQHVCNVDNVETVRLLRSDTKPCPSCGTYIHKTEGCDQMFCISCKQLWSWKTGKIEERGHNPHYLEWMRSRGGGANGGGGGMARDPLDIQCGREVNWQTTTTIEQECYKHKIGVTRSIVINWINSLIHVRHHDIPAMQRAMEVQGDLQELRVQYMRKKITEDHFRKRIFQIQRDANVSRKTLDLLVAVQNAGTDIVFRIMDTLQKQEKQDKQKNTTTIQEQIQSYVSEFGELKKWANQSIEDIYYENSKKVQKGFVRVDSFALIRV